MKEDNPQILVNEDHVGKDEAVLGIEKRSWDAFELSSTAMFIIGCLVVSCLVLVAWNFKQQTDIRDLERDHTLMLNAVTSMTESVSEMVEIVDRMSTP